VSKRKAKLLRRQRAGLCVFAAETVGVAHKLHPRHAGATEPKFVRQWRAWARYGGPLPKSDVDIGSRRRAAPLCNQCDGDHLPN
jgi:hypothetical protein